MKGELEILAVIEAYLNGEMTSEERADFEEQRRNDPVLDHKVVAHKQFLQNISQYGDRRRLVAEMNAIYDQLNVEALKEEVIPHTPVIRTLWTKYRISAAVAASVAILAVMTTLLSTGYFSKSDNNSSSYSALRREMSRELNNIKKSQHAMLNDMLRNPAKGPSSPGEYGGTGFALSENGYVLTLFHVVNGADSVYVQDNQGESFKVKVVYTDPAYDIAVLKINDDNFKSLAPLPYTFKKSLVDLGEHVYTIGFPKDNRVYNEGYISSSTGYADDTLAYQVSIPVNPGNSGGPLLDSKGSVIGVVSGKQTQTDGAAFAIKSEYLLKSLEAIPADSLSGKIAVNKKNNLLSLSRKDQIKKLKDYIFMVKVY